METPCTPHTDQAERQTWHSLLWGAFIWFAHLNLVYGLASLSCKWGWFTTTRAGIAELPLIETLISALTLPLLAITIYRPWRDWRRFQAQRPAANPQLLHDTEKDRRPLIAFVTMLLNSLFFLFVLATLVPVLALNPCAGAGG